MGNEEMLWLSLSLDKTRTFPFQSDTRTLPLSVKAMPRGPTPRGLADWSARIGVKPVANVESLKPAAIAAGGGGRPLTGVACFDGPTLESETASSVPGVTVKK